MKSFMHFIIILRKLNCMHVACFIFYMSLNSMHLIFNSFCFVYHSEMVILLFKRPSTQNGYFYPFLLNQFKAVLSEFLVK